MCNILASYVDILILKNYNSCIEVALVQQKLTHKVAVLRCPLSRYSWLLCIVYTQFTSEYNYSTFDKTKP